VAAGLALLFAAGVIFAQAPSSSTAYLCVRMDVVTCVMLLLVTSIGLVVVRYSQTYLHGEAGLVRHLRWLLLTLSAVTTLVITNNLLVLAVGWTATSFGLHQLLTFYRDRPQALIAAHKKFIVSRLADLCFVVSLAVIYRNVGSLDLDQISAWAESHVKLPTSMEVAAVFAVVAVALRSAQLPFHGWLIQVMEAPTPVSALLHAGVVNIGGFVLIRLAPWMTNATSAQLLLVVIGLVSAVIAALVMLTRVSIKVALAWSTCAQMGFMLVQCGLGLWQLALLHLVAHSLYKAHAFLSAGTAVENWRLQALTKRTSRSASFRTDSIVLTAAAFAVLCFAAVQQFKVDQLSVDELSALTFALFLILSLKPLVTRTSEVSASAWVVAARVSGVGLLFVGLHAAAMQLMPVPFSRPNLVAWGLTVLGFVGLFATKATLQRWPDGRFARLIYPWLFSCLYLDDCFTRLMFRVWPRREQTACRPTIQSALPRKVQA